MTGNWVALFCAILVSVAGQTLLKTAAAAPTFFAQLFDLRTILGMFFYGSAAVLYIVALRRIPMSVAMPCTSVSYLAAAAIGYFAFAEQIDAMKLGGLALIICGVSLVALR